MEESLKEEIHNALAEKGEWFGRIPLEDIKGASPNNARKHHVEENIEQLENSILLTSEVRIPIILNQDFQVVCGQRRWICAMKARLKEVPVVVRMHNNKIDELVDSYNENMLTQSLTNVDQQDAVKKIVDVLGVKKAAEKLGMNIATVSLMYSRLTIPDQSLKKEVSKLSRRGWRAISGTVHRLLKEDKSAEALKLVKSAQTLLDPDLEQLIADVKRMEPVDFEERIRRSREGCEKWEYMTLRIDMNLHATLTKICRITKMDKQVLINKVLGDFVKKWRECTLHGKTPRVLATKLI